jgi:hypothetical protein
MEECEEAGLTIKKLVETIMEGLGADSVKQQFDPALGGFIKSDPLADHSTRAKFVTLGKDILGLDAPKRLKAEVDHGFSISTETQELVQGLLSEFENLAGETRKRVTASLKSFTDDLPPTDS